MSTSDKCLENAWLQKYDATRNVSELLNDRERDLLRDIHMIVLSLQEDTNDPEFIMKKLIDQVGVKLGYITAECGRKPQFFFTILHLVHPLVPPSLFKYQTVDEFLSLYSNKFQSYDNSTKLILFKVANWMNILFNFISPKKNKGLILTAITKFVEGHGANYVTGSGQTSATTDRVHIYEQEGDQKPLKRMKPVTSNNSPHHAFKTSKDTKAPSKLSSKIRALHLDDFKNKTESISTLINVTLKDDIFQDRSYNSSGSPNMMSHSHPPLKPYTMSTSTPAAYPPPPAPTNKNGSFNVHNNQSYTNPSSTCEYSFNFGTEEGREHSWQTNLQSNYWSNFPAPSAVHITFPSKNKNYNQNENDNIDDDVENKLLYASSTRSIHPHPYQTRVTTTMVMAGAEQTSTNVLSDCDPVSLIRNTSLIGEDGEIKGPWSEKVIEHIPVGEVMKCLGISRDISFSTVTSNIFGS